MLETLKNLIRSARSIDDLRVVVKTLRSAEALVPLLVRGDSPLEQYFRDHTDDALNAIDELLVLIEKHPLLEQAIVKQLSTK